MKRKHDANKVNTQVRQGVMILLTFGCHWGFSIYSVDPTLVWLPYPKTIQPHRSHINTESSEG